jgi:hypothetical protein
MKVIVPLVITGLALLVIPWTAKADIAWSNGNIIRPGTSCDSVSSACGGVGWTIFDDFQLSSDDTVIAFSYVSDFSAGSAADYQSTNWSLWSTDPLGYFASSGLLASGNISDGNAAVAVLTTNDLSLTTYTFTVTGLSVILSPGIYWLGYENVLANGAATTDVMTDGAALPTYDEESDQGYPLQGISGNTAFTIVKNPEPGSLWLVALAGAAFFIKSRIRPRIKFSPAV